LTYFLFNASLLVVESVDRKASHTGGMVAAVKAVVMQLLLGYDSASP